MRMKFSRRNNLTFLNRVVTKDTEGVTKEEWGAPFVLVGEAWQTNGNLDVKTYGEKTTSICNARIEGDWNYNVIDGVEHYFIGSNFIAYGDAFSADGVNATHKITSIKATKPLQVVMEKI